MRSLKKKQEYFNKCRYCCTKGSKKYPKEDPRSKGLWERPDSIAVHGMDGRRAIIAIMGELKNVGCPDELMHMACKRFFGKDYKFNETDDALKYIKPIPPKCETLRQTLNVECDGCSWKPKTAEPEIKEKVEPILTQEEPIEEKKQASLDLSGIPAENFIMKYISYAVKMTDAYPEYHLGNALFLLSMAANRKIQVRFAHDTIYPNIWIFLIGDSTIARKTASITIGYEKIGVPVFGFAPYLPQSTSPEALIEELSNAPKSSLVRDEAGGFLRELEKNYMSGFKDVLCSLYDNKDYHRKIRTGQRKNAQTDFNIKNPFVNLLFATTPDVFKNYTNYLDVTSGWLVRFLYITPDHEKEWKGYRKETLDDSNHRMKIQEQLNYIKFQIVESPTVIDYELSDEATLFFTKWQQETETAAMRGKDKNKLRVLGRMHTYAVKIAMLILLGDGEDSNFISKSYIEIACKMVENYFLINACNLMEDISRDEQHNLQDRIIGILKTYGKTSMRDLMRYAHQPKKDLDEAIAGLNEHGSGEIKTTMEIGRKTLYFELNGNKSKKSVLQVAQVATVTTVHTVPKIQGILATNATENKINNDTKPIDSEVNVTLCGNGKENDNGNNSIKSKEHRRRLERYLCDSPDSCDSCDSRDSQGNQSPATALTKLLEKARKEYQKPINSGNIVEFAFWVCSTYKPQWQEQGKTDYYLPSAITGIASKLFGLTPTAKQDTKSLNTTKAN